MEKSAWNESERRRLSRRRGRVPLEWRYANDGWRGGAHGQRRRTASKWWTDELLASGARRRHLRRLARRSGALGAHSRCAGSTCFPTASLQLVGLQEAVGPLAEKLPRAANAARGFCLSAPECSACLARLYYALRDQRNR